MSHDRIMCMDLLYRLAVLLAVFGALAGLDRPVEAQEPRPRIFQVELDRGVTPPSVEFVRRAVREAEAAEATALVVTLSSGAGVLQSVWPLARELYAADAPVVVWVGPGAVQGGPAGALLLAAADVAVMSPDSSVGFALPLAQTPAGFSPETSGLIVDDVARELSGWQRTRGRNTEWLERAVRDGAIVDAETARSLEPPLVDFTAATSEELILGLHGRSIVDAAGTTGSLATVGAVEVAVSPAPLEWLTQTLALPTVAFVLFVLGAVAIYLEFANPGIGVPGVAGGTLVLAALYGFFQADVRPLAVLALAAGLVLAGLEHLVMSHGGLTLGGVILLVVGAALLVDPARSPGLAVAPGAIVGAVLLLGLSVLGLVLLAMRIRDQRPASGSETLVGQIAEVRRAIDPEGMVYVAGALWSAWSDDGPFSAGELVEVAGIEGLRLYVRRVDGDTGASEM